MNRPQRTHPRALHTGGAFGAATGVLTAGFVTVLVGFSSSYPLIVQTASAMGLSAEQLATMTAALSLGMGLTCLVPSLWWRLPVVIAWSTPGAALLAVSLRNIPLDQAIGAFIACAVLLTAVGASGVFERWMHRIPHSLASALLAGVLVRFGFDVFPALERAPWTVLPMLLVLLVGRRLWPRFAVPLSLLAGLLAVALQTGGLSWPTAASTTVTVQPLAWPPVWSTQAFLGVALPLFVVTMASQNLPGVAVLRASGYGHAPISALLTIVGLATLLLAPFGVFALNLAAITAALCMGPEAHPDPQRRWLAAAAAGVLYLLVAVFAAPLAALFLSLPKELVMTIAGLALLPTIGRGLHAALADEAQRDAALVTFLVTASGLTLWGIGPAFWGVVFGLIALIAWRTPDTR
jgi:benzoate membrane transport protein